MALFGKTKKTVKEVTNTAAAPAAKRAISRGTAKQAPGRVIMRPYMTEKSAMLAEKGTYVFVVFKTATKNEVIKAVQATFGVTVTRVNMMNTSEKKVRLGRHEGQISGFKKAMVTLKKGDTIDIGA